MSSPVDNGTAIPSTTIEEAPAPVATSSRSIYSFWGNGAGPSQPPPPPSAPPAKRRRKKADDDTAQGRIDTSASNGASWSIARPPEVVEPSNMVTVAKGKARARNPRGGESGEVKDMAKRTKQAVKRSRKKTNGEQDAEMVDGSIGGSPGGSSSMGPASSPPKPPDQVRRRGRPSKARPSPKKQSSAAIPGNLSTTQNEGPEVIHVVSSDPPQPASSPQYRVRDLSSTAKRLGFGKTSSHGSIDEPIDLEKEPLRPGPKKLVFAADQKAAHPLFARVTNGDAKSSRASSTEPPPSDTTSASKPAVIAKPVKTNKVHSFFGSNGSEGVPGRERAGWGGGVKDGDEARAPLPGGTWPSHLESEAAQRSFDGSSGCSKRRRINLDLPNFPSSMSLSALLSTGATDQPASSTVGSLGSHSLPDFIASHPAIRSAKRRHSKHHRETWVERYRPTTVDQVLGNESEARYLRDWLTALSVGKTNGTTRKVARKVNRPNVQLFEDWIVDDAGLFGDPVDPDEEQEQVEYTEFIEPHLDPGTRLDDYPPLETSQLTNTILLAGPNGSGKSATVAAAAAELGWEIFEVYPGMGKRTGGNLASWVGDVGKNHLVVKAGKQQQEEPKEKAGPLKSFFAAASKRITEDDDPIALTSSQGSQADPIHVDESPMNEQDLVLETNGASKDFRQSLILIDEADLLFQEENTFWPAVVALISESRRPVIITCNDIRRIPIERLPLQVILRFQPAPSYLAIPYLEAIAMAEGVRDPACGSQLYQDSCRRESDAVDRPLPPNGNEPLPTFDLRYAITQMQMDRTSTASQPKPVDEHDDLKTICLAIETASWTDAWVYPREWARIDVHEVDRYTASPDDELGMHALIKPDIHDFCCCLPAYDRSGDIGDTALRLAGGPLTSVGDLQSERVHHVRSLLPLLDPLVPLGAPLLPAGSIFAFDLPAIQEIVEWEDARNAEKRDAIAKGALWTNPKTGRATRTAAKGFGDDEDGYLEDVGEDGYRAARASRLRAWH